MLKVTVKKAKQRKINLNFTGHYFIYAHFFFFKLTTDDTTLIEDFVDKQTVSHGYLTETIFMFLL